MLLLSPTLHVHPYIATPPGSKIVQVISPLAGQRRSSDDAIITVEAFPVMPYSKAFDLVISAAGYNAAQEAVALGVPSVLIPNEATKTDDQARRARQLAERGGLALVAEGVDGLDSAIGEAFNADRLGRLRSNLARVDEPTGASESARIVDDIFERTRWSLSADVIYG